LEGLSKREDEINGMMGQWNSGRTGHGHQNNLSFANRIDYSK
jgi:hypothetical protein